MKKTVGIIFGIIIIGAAGIFALAVRNREIAERDFENAPPATSSPRQIISTGEITFGVPEGFGLAVKPEQVLVKSNPPPCDEHFDYCVYAGVDYPTNFESAGVRIKKRADLASNERCLHTQPDGYSDIRPLLHESANYSTSVFPNIGDAAAGHYANGEVYRLALPSACYEFETRIGVSQFANYEPGTIAEFSADNRHDFELALRGIIDNIMLAATGEHVAFPNVND